MDNFKPAYLTLLENAKFKERVQESHKLLEECECCGWQCRVNRLHQQLGKCLTGEEALVSSYGPHHGEEAPLSGWKGSGTIFFARCNLNCVFCQNHDISQTDTGKPMTVYELSSVMLHLQGLGCHNINLVSPSHVVPQIIEAIFHAASNGLTIPIVYNTGGYDSLLSLKLLDGIIDIYMPDMKYADDKIAKKYSGIPKYAQINRQAVKEMHLQVGNLQVNDLGLATRGILIRHLVLPDKLAGTEEIMKFIASELSTDTFINIMDQYHPEHFAHQYPEINRRIVQDEYSDAIKCAKDCGLFRLD